ncbi:MULTISPECIES: hypothetical protein [unclassified Corallococcus]|uniref:hypothetical protein n=1 Tax=Corallococcus sp. NCSPR001 TaxID=2813576 RepID=UPI001F5C8D03|nr:MULTISPECIES: hypothetical protein [unclassified Corallococcus]WAS85489.1 hypothetical protein O0N60_00620 [Corallococcus sp. NCRR]
MSVAVITAAIPLEMGSGTASRTMYVVHVHSTAAIMASGSAMPLKASIISVRTTPRASAMAST